MAMDLIMKMVFYYGGNPEIEFVGDPTDEHGYGVYQKPIIEVANKFKSGMVDYTGHSLEAVLEIVKNEFLSKFEHQLICKIRIYVQTGFINQRVKK